MSLPKPVAHFWCTICRGTSWGQWEACTSSICGGNRARYERAKLTYGVKVIYSRCAMDVDRPPFSPELMSELYTRLGGNVPVHLSEWAWREVAYCLDAPDRMPAGGCHAIAFGEKVGRHVPKEFPAQLEVTRE